MLSSGFSAWLARSANLYESTDSQKRNCCNRLVDHQPQHMQACKRSNQAIPAKNVRSREAHLRNTHWTAIVWRTFGLSTTTLYPSCSIKSQPSALPKTCGANFSSVTHQILRALAIGTSAAMPGIHNVNKFPGYEVQPISAASWSYLDQRVGLSHYFRTLEAQFHQMFYGRILPSRSAPPL